MALLEEVTKLNTPSPVFGSSLLNGSLGKGKDRSFDEHLDSFLNLQITVCFIPTKSHLSPFQTKPGINLKTQTLKNDFAPGFSFAQYSRNFRILKVDGLLMEVLADWDDLKAMLSSIEALRWYNKRLT